jgi:hypothetical protein
VALVPKEPDRLHSCSLDLNRERRGAIAYLALDLDQTPGDGGMLE